VGPKSHWQKMQSKAIKKKKATKSRKKKLEGFQKNKKPWKKKKKKTPVTDKHTWEKKQGERGKEVEGFGVPGNTQRARLC